MTRVLLYQGPSPAGDIEGAFATIARELQTAAAAGADLAVFPELFLPGYNFDRVGALTEAKDGLWSARLGEMARDAGCGLVAGYAERQGEDLYNAALAIGPDGRMLANYRKIQLYGPREAALFRPGDRYAIFDYQGRRAALLICYDVEFDGHVAALAKLGVELILVPTANMVPFQHVCRNTVPAHAFNHAVAIVYANFCGIEGDLTYCGESLIVARDGAVLARAGAGPATLIVDLDHPVDPERLSTQGRDWRPVG
ncbi:MAG: carbon-nitrogen hydrolase family protein [Albidovulum sp.]|uniref:carbon-nitrogen hydrolase family protein n=1 Tax=Albidovulum sp. TaxID=1872424 RepID=UPI003CBD7B91